MSQKPLQDPQTLLLNLSRRMEHLESNVIAPLAATVELMGRKLQDHDDEEPGRPVPGHRPWKCEGCRALLGIHDEKADTMRIRVKDFHVRVHPADGGWLEISCRRCGHLNRVTNEPSSSRG